MAVFALSDLHLTFQVEKPMDIFGTGWQDYVQRISENWRQTITPQDAVCIPGDVSWATYLEQAKEDFAFIDALPGMKYISKGNHDYWWETVTKMNAFLRENGFDSIRFVHNSAFEAGEFVVCAAKGFDRDTSQRLKDRECIRLENSLQAGKRLSPEKPVLVMLHYPPFYKNGEEITELTSLFSAYGVHTCVYGHIHNDGHGCPVREKRNGIWYKLVSCDRVGFLPVRVALE